jgi:chromosome segregation ATPase
MTVNEKVTRIRAAAEDVVAELEKTDNAVGAAARVAMIGTKVEEARAEMRRLQRRDIPQPADVDRRREEVRERIESLQLEREKADAEERWRRQAISDRIAEIRRLSWPDFPTRRG